MLLIFRCRSGCDRYRPVCSFPQGTVRLRDPVKLLSADQEYSVSVSLDMPESEVNRQLGMFMVNISFISSSGQVISSSGRHLMLRYHSQLVRYMSTLFYWLPLVLGFSEERQVLGSEICGSYIDHSVRRFSYHGLTLCHVVPFVWFVHLL